MSVSEPDSFWRRHQAFLWFLLLTFPILVFVAAVVGLIIGVFQAAD